MFHALLNSPAIRCGRAHVRKEPGIRGSDHLVVSVLYPRTGPVSGASPNSSPRSCSLSAMLGVRRPRWVLMRTLRNAPSQLKPAPKSSGEGVKEPISRSSQGPRKIRALPAFHQAGTAVCARASSKKCDGRSLGGGKHVQLNRIDPIPLISQSKFGWH